MRDYRKKPVIIQAEQWFPTRTIEGVRTIRVSHPWFDLMGRHGSEYDASYGEIDTLEGTMRVSPGDFVIRGVQGELYPCKPDIFAATYEVVR